MPNVQSFGDRSVTFQDGKTIDIDAIVLTTGFVSECSFLEDPDAWPFAGRCSIISYALLESAVWPDIHLKSSRLH